MKEIPILDNKKVLRENLQIFLFSLLLAAWNLIRKEPFGSIMILTGFGILSGIYTFLYLLVYALRARDKLNLSLDSVKDVLLWALLLTYYAWSFFFWSYMAFIEDFIQTAFHSVPPPWLVAFILFAFWFVQFLIIFYVVYRTGSQSNQAK